MRAFKVFINTFEAPQRSETIKIKFMLSLCLGSRLGGLKRLTNFRRHFTDPILERKSEENIHNFHKYRIDDVNMFMNFTNWINKMSCIQISIIFYISHEASR